MSSIVSEQIEYDLNVYNKVNSCESLTELAKVIMDLSKFGIIEGRTRTFDGVAMSNYCERLDKNSEFRILTRQYGIRQQAYYLVYENQ